ncbi:MAG: RidA family protein [Chitinophagaceae bacterium]|nr:RidA family protein [Chitinophagaceae bacterium]
MAKQIIKTDKGPAPIGPYSQAVAAGNMLFISGQVAKDAVTGNLITDDIAKETGKVMENLQAILTAAGFEFSDVVKTTIFLTDMKLFAAVNEVYGSFFNGEYPARETVAVSGLPLGVNVEISMIANK